MVRQLTCPLSFRRVRLWIHRQHPDLHVIQLHQLARPDLGGLAQLLHTIDADRATGDDRLALATAVGDAGQLEQLVERWAELDA